MERAAVPQPSCTVAVEVTEWYTVDTEDAKYRRNYGRLVYFRILLGATLLGLSLAFVWLALVAPPPPFGWPRFALAPALLSLIGGGLSARGLGATKGRVDRVGIGREGISFRAGARAGARRAWARPPFPRRVSDLRELGLHEAEVPTIVEVHHLWSLGASGSCSEALLRCSERHGLEISTLEGRGPWGEGVIREYAVAPPEGAFWGRSP